MKNIFLFLLLSLFYGNSLIAQSDTIHKNDKEAYHLFFVHKKTLDTLVSKSKHLQLTEENFLLLCDLFKIQYPRFVLKQAILESGNFKSNVFNNTNNLFGMKRPGARRTYALKKKYKLNYACYESWIHSLADYKLWQGNKTITGNYADYLEKRSFAEAKDYKEKLK